MDNKLPIITITSDQLDAIKDWKVGGKYRLIIDVEEKSTQQGSMYDFEKKDPNLITSTFQITAVEECEDNETADDMPDDYEQTYASKMSSKE